MTGHGIAARSCAVCVTAAAGRSMPHAAAPGSTVAAVSGNLPACSSVVCRRLHARCLRRSPGSLRQF